MKWVFWISGVLLVPLVGATIAFFSLYIAHGDDEHKARATIFYRWSVVVMLATFNIWIFTRVIRGLWELMR